MARKLGLPERGLEVHDLFARAVLEVQRQWIQRVRLAERVDHSPLPVIERNDFDRFTGQFAEQSDIVLKWDLVRVREVQHCPVTVAERRRNDGLRELIHRNGLEDQIQVRRQAAVQIGAHHQQREIG